MHWTKYDYQGIYHPTPLEVDELEHLPKRKKMKADWFVIAVAISAMISIRMLIAIIDWFFVR